MKLKDGYILRTIAGSNVVVPTGERAADLNGMITLNDTGAFIWKQLAQETDEEKIVAALLEVYDVDAEHARKSVDAFLEQVRAAGCLA